METFLATKLFVPRAPALSVPRGRLYEMLDAADDTPLVLVSAPAGFGKTTLLAGWIRDRGHPAAWVSLDDGDDEPRRFWGYLTAALRSVTRSACAKSVSVSRQVRTCWKVAAASAVSAARARPESARCPFAPGASSKAPHATAIASPMSGR